MFLEPSKTGIRLWWAGHEDQVGMASGGGDDRSPLPGEGGQEPPASTARHNGGLRGGEQSDARVLCLALGCGGRSWRRLSSQNAPWDGMSGSEHGSGCRGGAAWETRSGSSKRCFRLEPGRSPREVQVHHVKSEWTTAPCPTHVPFSSSHSSYGLIDDGCLELS